MPEKSSSQRQLRTCISCRKTGSKRDLLRLVWSSGELKIDRCGNASGRGAYLHRSMECWSRMNQPGKWSRALRLSEGQITGAVMGRAMEEARRTIEGGPESGTVVPEQGKHPRRPVRL